LAHKLLEDLDLRRTLFVDNSPLCFLNHSDNGVPIIPYYGCSNDCELLQLKDFINFARNHPDYREIVKPRFNFKSLAAQQDVRAALELLRRNYNKLF
jgi:CTD small phosphatase-like protein 2